jgi:pyruvate,water dikinase
MVASSSGRIYYKISSWYTLIKFLPFSNKIIPIWQDMLGVKNKTYDNSKIKIPFFTKIKIYLNTFKELKHVSQNMDSLNNKFIEINDYFYSHFNDKLSTKEVIKLYGVIKDELLSCWDITLVNDLYSFIYTGLLKNRLSKKNYSEELVNDYISGISNIESLKPVKSIIELAYKKDKLKRKEYKLLYEDYISKYGDRNLEELKLESETFRTNNKLLNKKIEEYRKDKNKLEIIYSDLNKDKVTNIKEDFITRFISKRAMQGIKNREISRLNRSRIYGMVRSMFLQIGKNLVKEKRIRKREDIFYLTIEEVFNYKKYNLKKLISSRKKEYKMYKELPGYSRLVFSEKEFDKSHKRINKVTKDEEKDILEGTPTSNGIVKGKALVIEDINDSYDVKDRILITKMTDPGWVFLLINAKGVIAEKGSILSHTAIISREIKIPSIVGVEDATTIIKTGDYIEMDAYKGKIKIMKRGKK